jgi:hypothetical protein
MGHDAEVVREHDPNPALTAKRPITAFWFAVMNKITLLAT